MTDHRTVTRREFAHQADHFERAGSLFSDRDILDWIGGYAPAASRVLDVAGGTGQLGRHLGGSMTVIVDLTPEMLAAGAAAVEAEGRDDVLFVRGDATALPFAAAQFDLVTCRFALHHVDDPARAVEEMARVRRGGGAVLTVDMVVADGPIGDRHNEVERMRDPSHATALRESELRAIHEAAGLSVERTALREQMLDGERWLTQAASPAADTDGARAALEAEAGGGEPTGLDATVEDGRLTIRHRWLLVLAR